MFSKSTIKYIQSLQHKKFRDEYNVFIAEGPKVVTELLLSGIFPCKAVYATEDWTALGDQTILTLIADRVNLIKDFELEKIAHYTTPNKVVAVFEKRPARENIPVKNRITLALDDIRDPGNLGTIIRTADWFGIANIICSTHTADMYNPKVVQSTMASLGRVNVIYTDLANWISNVGGIKKIATTLQGKPISSIRAIKEAVIVIGNESKGVSDDIISLADEQVTIPKTGSVESLNAAVATGIILYALRS